MKLLVFEYGQFKHAQREKTPKLVRLRVVMLGITLGGVVWNLIYWSIMQVIKSSVCTCKKNVVLLYRSVRGLYISEFR